MRGSIRSCLGLLAVVLVAATAAGCGAADPRSSGGTTSPPAGGSSLSPAPATTPPGESAPPKQASPTGLVELRGTVEQGVEAGCLVLRATNANGQMYLLMNAGDRSAIFVGSRVVVHGRPKPDMLTTCQQGIPFEVVDARPA